MGKDDRYHNHADSKQDTFTKPFGEFQCFKNYDKNNRDRYQEENPSARSACNQDEVVQIDDGNKRQPTKPTSLGKFFQKAVRKNTSATMKMIAAIGP